MQVQLPTNSMRSLWNCKKLGNSFWTETASTILAVRSLVLVLIFCSAAISCLSQASAQYFTQHVAPTKWGLDREVGVFDELPLE